MSCIVILLLSLSSHFIKKNKKVLNFHRRITFKGHQAFHGKLITTGPSLWKYYNLRHVVFYKNIYLGLTDD